MSVIEIKDSNFDEMIKSNDKVMVDCYATWCGPCKMISSQIEDLSNERSDVSFYKINIDENQDVVMKFKIVSIPTILIFEKGELKDTRVGYMSKDELNALI